MAIDISYKEWIESCLSELRRAKERLRYRNYAYACFHAEQAVEFALKAFLIAHGNFL
ncbi:MAG: HEPN domain-containing protein [Thermoprotei archaeon]|nr:HEPN domain-containing protein [Thermoprotei archaeon]